MFARKLAIKKKSRFFSQDREITKKSDEAAIASLPDEWDPRHSGEILETFILNCKKKHENLVTEMKNAAEYLNYEVDNQLKHLIEIIMDDVRKYESNIHKILIDKSEMVNSVPNTANFNEKVKELDTKHQQHDDNITKFRFEAMDLERHRNDYLKKLLANFLQRFILIGYQKTEDIKNYFNTHNVEINQQWIYNGHTVIELEDELRSNASRLYEKGKIDLIEKAYNPIVLNENQNDIDDLAHNISEENPTLNISVDLKYSKTEMKNRLQKCLSHLVEIYLLAVMKILSGFYQKLALLNGGIENCDLESLDNDHTVMELQEMIDQVTENLAKLKDDDGLHKIQIHSIGIQKSLHELGIQVHDAHQILHEAVSLFNSHNTCVNLLQKQTIQAVDVLGTNHDTLERASQDGFNKVLEQLRQSSDIDKLQQIYKDVAGHLRNIENSYLLHKYAELHRLEECKVSISETVDALVGKLSQFLEKYLRVVDDESSEHKISSIQNEQSDNNVINQQKFHSSSNKDIEHADDSITNTRDLLDTSSLNIKYSDDNETEAVLPSLSSLDEMSEKSVSNIDLDKVSINSNIPYQPDKLTIAILNTGLQVKALHRWKNDFLQSMESNREIIPDELPVQAQNWVDKETVYVNMRYETKIKSLKIYYEKVNATIDLRKAELEYHDKLLTEHSLAVQKIIEHLYKDVTNPLTLESPQLYPLLRCSVEIENLINELNLESVDVTIMKMSSYSLRLEKHRQLFEKSINPAVETIRELVEQKILETRKANTKFMSEIHTFSEGGRFSDKEAEKALNTLSRNSYALDTCASRVNEVLNKIPDALLQNADQYLAPLRQIIFNCLPKHVDKRNQQSNNK